MLVDSPVPGVAGYGQTLNTAKLAYQQALSKIGLNRQNTLRQYGYQADFDPTTGLMQNMRIDGGNQFGGLQTLLRSHAQDAQGATDNAVGRGLHGGLAHQMQTGLDWQHGQQDAQFGQQVGNDLSAETGQWNDATTSYNNTLYEAQQQAARDAIMNQMFNQGDYSGIDPSQYGNTSPYVGDPTDANNELAAAGDISKIKDNANHYGPGNLPSTRSQAASAVMSRVAPQAASALAARSKALNSQYGLSKPTKAASVVKNTYTNPKSKKRG